MNILYDLYHYKNIKKKRKKKDWDHKQDIAESLMLCTHFDQNNYLTTI